MCRRLLISWFLLWAVVEPLTGQGGAPFCVAGEAGLYGKLAEAPFNAEAGMWRLRDTAAGERIIPFAADSAGLAYVGLEALLEFSTSESNAIGLVGLTGADSSGWMIHLGASGAEDRPELYRWRDGRRGEFLGAGRFVHGDGSTTVVSWRLELGSDSLRLFSREKFGLRWRREAAWQLGGELLSPHTMLLWLRYTSTRRERVLLRRLCYGADVPEAGGAEYWEAAPPGELRMLFGRPVYPGPAFGIWLAPAGDPPVDLQLDSAALGVLRASWEPEGLPVRAGPVHLRGLRDSQGEDIPADTLPVTWLFPENASFSLAITELMFDPDPPRGWPNSEFVEILNSGADTLFAREWQLCDDGGCGTIEDFALAPEAQLLLVPADRASEWSRMGVPVAPVQAWRSLNNSGDVIVVKNFRGQMQDSTAYHTALLEPADKRDGGWSLTRQESACGLGTAWYFSNEPSGASPGTAGSGQAYCRYLQQPLIDMRGDSLMLKWPFRASVPPIPEEWSMTGGVEVLSSQLDPGDSSRWITRLSMAPGGNPATALHFARDILDDCGEILWRSQQKIPLGSATSPDSAQLVISEILLRTDKGAAFIEVHNRTDHSLHLSDCLVYIPRLSRWWFFPQNARVPAGAHLALSPEPCRLRNAFNAPDTARITAWEALTNLPFADSLTIKLIRVEGLEWQLLDEAHYEPAWHSESFRDAPDVSLRRLHPGQSGTTPDNWFSSLPPGPQATPGWAGQGSAQDDNVRRGDIHISGTVHPDDPAMLWTLRWHLPDGQWQMMTELFTIDGVFSAYLQPPGPVNHRGQLGWDFPAVRELLTGPGLYLTATSFWSDSGRHLRHTGYLVAAPAK